jgi:beta-fructofuranosidase
MTHLFPLFHVRPPYGFVNDPNGPIIVNGVVHLYYQYRTDASGLGPVSWGHVTSTDLAHWTYHRPAMSPVPNGLDRDGCWSGTTVVDENGRVRAFYSGLIAGKPYQSVLTAVSNDGGMTFGDPRQVVADPGSDEGVRAFRDPFVWKDDGRWRMAVGVGEADEQAAIRSYSSTDLENWTPDPPFATLRRSVIGDIDTGSMWECPQIVSIEGTDIALVSTMADGRQFGEIIAVAAPTSADAELAISRYDVGGNLYAASVLRQSPHGPIIWGWVTESRSGEWAEEDGWSGMLSLPRVASWRDGALRSSPAPGLTALRSRELAPREDAGAARIDGAGAQLEVELALAPGSDDVWLELAFSDSERLTIALHGDSGEVVVDTTSASADPRARGRVYRWSEGALLDESGFEVRAFVDGSVVELFTSSGTCATFRVYPTTPPPWSVRSHGAGSRLRAWRLGE